MQYADFFRLATGNDPYPFQQRFAEAAELPHLLRAPTGAGKTATAVIGWLWRYVHGGMPTPRRLVYCLPMRVLVEQSEREANRWVAKLVKAKALPQKVPVHVLMGGVDTEDWYLDPEKPALLIGTQDMLLSRALNRGYAAGRFHWPIDFGLLNNDCLWVYDEPQLMGSGVSTSAQLAGLRRALDTFGACPSVWMSATLEPVWLDTVDFRDKFPAPPHELTDADYDSTRPLYERMTAAKTLAPLGVRLTKDADDKELKAVADKVLKLHRENPGTQTLVILNTVKRAKAVYAALETPRRRDETPKLLLVHSRFRPKERQHLNAALQDKGAAAADRIIVATQVVEAGVDISSRTLVTELAPWASIVQRIGRCNRTGHDGPGRVFWIDLDEKLTLPYTAEELAFATTHLNALEGKSVSPKALDEYKRDNDIKLPFVHTHVLRRRDLLDLFDTSADLSGNDIDISRFVRGDDPETDVQVFWREIGHDGPPDDEPTPQRLELCSVPVGQARDFITLLAEKKRGTAYVWDHLDDKWAKLDAKQVRPGLTIILPTTAGGYSTLGWDAASTTPVEPIPPAVKVREEGTSSEPNSTLGTPLTIATHTENVYRELTRATPTDPPGILDLLAFLSEDLTASLRSAARWHDVGKAHDAFQHGMRKANPDLDTDTLWAKSGGTGRLRHGRKKFRHELASALATLQTQPAWPFAVAYLIASHHGKVRLSIRALPGEKSPVPPDKPFALGVHHGDPLPDVTLGDGVTCSQMQIDLSPMQLGGDKSWTGRALKLLAELGPFRLAYLEAVLRAADVRASRKEAGRG